MHNTFAKEDVNKKVNEGKIMRVKSKFEREQEDMIKIGNKKHKGGKKKKEE